LWYFGEPLEMSKHHQEEQASPLHILEEHTDRHHSNTTHINEDKDVAPVCYSKTELGVSESLDAVSLGSLESSDTIPLGTDLDPFNYNNLWIANRLKNPIEKLMGSSNLGWRVLDGENIGVSYCEFMKKKDGYECGVRRAADYFVQRGIRVIIVTRRRSMKKYEASNIDVVIADSTDDVMTIKQAQLRNCPIVSRDGFRKEKADRRLAAELRQWLQDTEELQVRYTWGSAGEFLPDWDLQNLVMKSSPKIEREWSLVD